MNGLAEVREVMIRKPVCAARLPEQTPRPLLVHPSRVTDEAGNPEHDGLLGGIVGEPPIRREAVIAAGDIPCERHREPGLHAPREASAIAEADPEQAPLADDRERNFRRVGPTLAGERINRLEEAERLREPHCLLLPPESLGELAHLAGVLRVHQIPEQLVPELALQMCTSPKRISHDSHPLHPLRDTSSLPVGKEDGHKDRQ